MLYSQPETAARVMLVDVLLSIIGAGGGVSWGALPIKQSDEVTLPLQFAAVTTTSISLFMSSCTGTYVDEVAPLMFVDDMLDWRQPNWSN
jgi:hypothetical protein